MFETERAMLVGRKILKETRGASRVVTHRSRARFRAQSAAAKA
jgi:hypothetical protein